MKKRVLSALLAATVACTVFAGCGGGNQSSSSNGDVFKIGGIGPATGGASVYGNAVKNGAQIAVDEINAAGGINGYKVEFNFQDDEHDAEKSKNAYNSLKDWKMQILMGTVTTAPCLAVIEETNVDKIFQITPSASALDVIKYDNCFQICFTDPNQGTKSAQYINDNKLATKVGIIYDSSDAYSQGIEAKFVEEAKNCANFEVVAAEAFTGDNKSDFSIQLKKLADAGAELVFLPIYATEAATLLSQASSYNFTYFGCDGLDGILTVDGFDTKLAEGTMLLTPFAADSTDEKTQSFVAKYKEQYKEVPNQFAADAYDAIYTIKAAIEKAGVTPADANDKICEALTKAMTEITVNGLTGGKDGLRWTADGAVNKAPKAVKIQDGAYVALD